MSWRRALALASEAPLDFTLQYPPSREYFRERFAAPRAREAAWSAPRRLLLYVHVPFCEARCFYCNFAVDLRKGASLHARYVEALCGQLARLDAALPEGCTVPGIDVGGGTPTLLAPELLARVLGALVPWRRRCEGAWPLSIETTPRMAEDAERLAVLREGGVDRVSMGLQSTNDETLAAVNRRAQRSLGERAVGVLAGAGFRRVNVDLVFGLPGQTRRHWMEDLRRVVALPVDSVTTYDCLYRGAGRAMPKLTAVRPTPEDYGALYDAAYEYLTAHGFHAPYGSVNFSRHAGETGTSPYFEGRLLDGLPYVGTGNYASSQVGARWWFAPHGVDAYLEAMERGAVLPEGEGYVLPDAERCAKYALLSLHFGLLDAARFRAFAGVELEALYGGPLAHAREAGWLRESGGVYRVVPGQFRRMPWIRSLFYAPGAVDWLEARRGGAGSTAMG